MCGLAACIMASDVMKTKDYEYLELDDFLEVAIENNFTKQGEMFQAEHLAELAEMVLKCRTEVLYGNINESYQKIMTHLMDGHPWIVPHDADHDHRPVSARATLEFISCLGDFFPKIYLVSWGSKLINARFLEKFWLLFWPNFRRNGFFYF